MILLVVDASVTLTGLLGEPRAEEVQARVTPFAASLRVQVPAVWKLEVINGILIAARRGRISAEQAWASVGNISDSNFTVGEVPDLGAIWKMATTYGLTAYDATYLELAQRLGAVLATLDDDLAAAARRMNMELLL